MRYWPPSTTIACPVINAASSLVKNTTAPVTSSGSPSRLIGLLFPGSALLFFRLRCSRQCMCKARQHRISGNAVAGNVLRQASHEPGIARRLPCASSRSTPAFPAFCTPKTPQAPASKYGHERTLGASPGRRPGELLLGSAPKLSSS